MVITLTSNETIEYLYEFFDNDVEKLEAFHRMFDNFQFSVSVEALNRFRTHQDILKGVRLCEIAKKYDMNYNTVCSIKKRMFDNGIITYAKENHDKIEEIQNGNESGSQSK